MKTMPVQTVCSAAYSTRRGAADTAVVNPAGGTGIDSKSRQCFAQCIHCVAGRRLHTA